MAAMAARRNPLEPAGAAAEPLALAESAPPHRTLRFRRCGASSRLLPLGLAASIAVSFLIGAGSACSPSLSLRICANGPAIAIRCSLVGLGTGARLSRLQLSAALHRLRRSAGLGWRRFLCLAASGITLLPAPQSPEDGEHPSRDRRSPFLRVLACFTALVWLDSAAFFIIQNTPALKAGTWQGSLHLWANGLLHLAAALASAWLLRRRGLSLVLSAAFLALGVACLLLLDPDRALLASIFYPIGVSLYSVALVAYPSLLAPAASAAERGRMAGWIYAIAGWTGSAMGIGMGQNLGHVPPPLSSPPARLFCCLMLFRLLRRRTRELALTAVVLLAAFSLDRFLARRRCIPQLTQVERGRQVYISEGCIHCHSQYVRPNSPDVLMWGPVETIAGDSPASIRRSSAIAARVPTSPRLERAARPCGSRRTSTIPPRSAAPPSCRRMHFSSATSAATILSPILRACAAQDAEQHLAEERLWQPSAAAVRASRCTIDGERLYRARLRHLPRRGRRNPPHLAVGLQAAPARSRNRALLLSLAFGSASSA